jgi:hypothetical protein
LLRFLPGIEVYAVTGYCTPLLLLLVTSSGAGPYPLTLVPRRRSPSLSTAHWLGLGIESHDPGARPLPDGAVKLVNRRSSQLLHALLISGGVPESEGLASLEGSVGSGGGTTREGVGEVGGVVTVHGASGPLGRPRGPMEMCAVHRITGAPMGPVTVVMRCSLL